jgi:hypothetical protein
MNEDRADVTDNDNFGDVLQAYVNVSSANCAQVSKLGVIDDTICGGGAIKSRSGKEVSPDELAKRWNIPLDRARRTVTTPTQRGVVSTLHPSINRRQPTNDRMLRYKRLLHTCFTDTMIAGIPSKRGNKYAQVFSASYGWARAFPMKRKGGAHEALSLLFQRDGVPPTMVADNSKE